ncbi:MAG: histidinol dehydrogenase [Burkholderiales bacterium]|jgi:histidinol dehydrogenase|nr:histidinol dehydrogenase [Burkholderiales bacterium]
MQITEWSKCDAAQRKRLLTRPAIGTADAIEKRVATILQKVKADGDDALLLYTEELDKVSLRDLRVSSATINEASARLSDEIKTAIQTAIDNIETFHRAQRQAPTTVETMPGISCQMVTRPIYSVGLYIPGGSAPLLSTVLMLAIPAKIAGCARVVLCSPPPISNEILYAAYLCGVNEIFSVGGAQAIAAMAFGTKTIPRVDKIFGPGNAYVTEAKRQVSQCHDGAAIDMPAGPSEVLVIADERANPEFIAIDLLSQAEHGPDSQVILVTPSRAQAEKVSREIDRLLKILPRAAIAEKALATSHLIITDNLDDCITISNAYGPEHLIIQTRDPQTLIQNIQSAGSVFVGDWSPEAAGDYASGTNHVLPTYGYTRTYSSLGLADFQKRMTVQTLTQQGLQILAPTITAMAAAEQLEAHRQAVLLRVQSIGKDSAS